LVLLLASAVLLLAPAHGLGAEPSSRADAILGRIAGQATHGFTDAETQVEELEARLAAGGRISVGCVVIGLLGQRALARAGITSRLVSTITREAFDGVQDGHSMLEVRLGRRWVVYDLDRNRQPVDYRGRGMPVTRFVNEERRRWRVLAHDPELDLTGAPPGYSAAIFLDIDRWYDRVLGTPLIPYRGSYVFDRIAERNRLEALSPAFRWVPRRTFRRAAGGAGGT